MPRRILPDSLKLLGRIYRFAGSRIAPEDAELDLPLQFVHDVSREAEFGRVEWNDGINAQRSSFFTIKADNVHGAGGSLQQLLGVYSNSSFQGWQLSAFDAPDPDEFTVWVLGVSALADDVLATARAYLLASPLPLAGTGAGYNRNQLVWYAPESSGFSNTDGQNPLIALTGDQQGGPLPYPLTNKLTNNAQLEFVSNVSAATTIEIAIRCMILPVGIYPPGLR